MRGRTIVPAVTVTKICDGGELVGSVTRAVRNLMLKNNGPDPCYIQWTEDDSTTLDENNGFPLDAGAAIGISRERGSPPVYGYCVGGETATINFMGE
mgnify:CR=1 FL=1